jgi:hypothetical protein
VAAVVRQPQEVAPVVAEHRVKVMQAVLAPLRTAAVVAQVAGHPQRVGVDQDQLEAPAVQEQHPLSPVLL